jgi:NarL family two-component system sensor histidine kinase LiaS
MWWQRNSLPRLPSSLPNRSERVELARRLHDGLAQELSALGYSLDELIGRDQLDSQLRSELRDLRLRVIEIGHSFRDEIYLLRSMSFREMSLEVQALFRDRRTEISLPEVELESNVEDSLARAILEMARNSARHSDSPGFKIDYRLTGAELVITVTDHGLGKISLKERSFGLASIQELLERAAADFELQSDANGHRYLISLRLK